MSKSIIYACSQQSLQPYQQASNSAVAFTSTVLLLSLVTFVSVEFPLVKASSVSLAGYGFSEASYSGLLGSIQPGG